MDIFRLFSGILLLAMILLATSMVVRADIWAAAVRALNLRWDREQRQSSGTEVPLAQRQAAQAEFERLVTNRPLRLFWLSVSIVVSAWVFLLILSWNLDDLRWVGLWLVMPFGIATLAICAYGWWLIDRASATMTVISTSLYGPAPPRVKVRNIQHYDAENPFL